MLFPCFPPSFPLSVGGVLPQKGGEEGWGNSEDGDITLAAYKEATSLSRNNCGSPRAKEATGGQLLVQKAKSGKNIQGCFSRGPQEGVQKGREIPWASTWGQHRTFAATKYHQQPLGGDKENLAFLLVFQASAKFS